MSGGHKTWHLARDYCESLGGHLLRIESPAENTFVSKYFSGGNHWIDVSDAEKENVWTNSKKEPLQYTNWAPGQPNGNSFDPNVAHAGYLFNGDGYPHGWYNFPSGVRMTFICEWDGPVVQNRTPQSSRLTDTETTPHLHRARLTISDLNGVWECWLDGGRIQIKNGKMFDMNGNSLGKVSIIDEQGRVIRLSTVGWEDRVYLSEGKDLMAGKGKQNQAVWWRKIE